VSWIRAICRYLDAEFAHVEDEPRAAQPTALEWLLDDVLIVGHTLRDALRRLEDELCPHKRSESSVFAALACTSLV
jgi:hypothetical protein